MQLNLFEPTSPSSSPLSGQHGRLDRTLPKRGRGRPTADALARYERELEMFCRRLISSRGWGYLLEQHGLAKGDFDIAERLINDCRKAGHLPVDFCAEDDGRAVDHLEEINHETVETFAEGWVDYLSEAHEQYTPLSFWDD